VSRAIAILRTELVRTLKLLGCPSASDLNPSFVTPSGVRRGSDPHLTPSGTIRYDCLEILQRFPEHDR
jgi:hypothetical protein